MFKYRCVLSDIMILYDFCDTVEYYLAEIEII